MSALERFGVKFDAILVYLNDKLVQGDDLDAILDNPLFVEFIAPLEEKLYELGFIRTRDRQDYPRFRGIAVCYCITTHNNGISVNYVNRFDPWFKAFISCRHNGDSVVKVGVKNSGLCIDLAQVDMNVHAYYSDFKARMQTVRALEASEAENAALREKIRALEAEILHLKLRPGGEEYELAREHFEQLRDEL